MWRLPTFVCLVVLAPCSSAMANDNRCFTTWSEAAPVVRRESLVAVEDISARARTALNGEVVKTTLCEEHGRYIYRLLVRAPHGQLKIVSVDARKPFER